VIANIDLETSSSLMFLSKICAVAIVAGVTCKGAEAPWMIVNV
jgi:hypothetical protein